LLGVPVGAQCQLTQSNRSSPPSGLAWGPLTWNPSDFIFQMPVEGKSVTLTNALVTATSMSVTKVVTGGTVDPATLFAITVTCIRNDIGTIVDMSPSATQFIAAGGTATFSPLPLAAFCQVSEGPLPTPPAGYVWNQPTLPSSISLGPGANPVTVTNR